MNLSSVRNLKTGVALLIVLAASTAPSQMRADDVERLAPLVRALSTLDDPAAQADLLLGARDGLKGRRNVGLPPQWPAVYAKLSKSPNASVREFALELALTFGDPQAIVELRRIAVDKSVDGAKRISAIESLVEKNADGMSALLHSLLEDSATRLAAIRGLASRNQADTPAALLSRYAQLSAAERGAAVATLASRKDFATKLLDAVDAKSLAASDISAFAARQIASLGDATLTDRLRKSWGEIRDTPQQKLAQIARLKQSLNPDSLKKANLSNGRLVYSKTCQQCHVLFNEGGKIGPELTGSNRANLDYILSNIVDPSAEIGRGYRMSILTTTGGRVLTGIVVEQDSQRLTIQTPMERLTLPRGDVEELKESPLSMMPEGQLEKLTSDQIRDLVAYLAAKSQVNLPK